MIMITYSQRMIEKKMQLHFHLLRLSLRLSRLACFGPLIGQSRIVNPLLEMLAIFYCFSTMEEVHQLEPFQSLPFWKIEALLIPILHLIKHNSISLQEWILYLKKKKGERKKS